MFSATVAASPTFTTLYTISATDAGTGCNITGTVNVTVNPIPTAVVITPASATVCENSVQQLTASGGTLTNLSILSENFNGTAPGWLQTNASVGGTPANAAWSLYLPGSISSNDASQMAGSNSDAQGSTSTSTATIFYSPTFSLVGYNTANLNFYQYYRSQAVSTDFARVEVSTNGGGLWTNLVTYTNTSQGTATAFLNTNLSLTPYVGNAAVQIRFKYDAQWDWYWFIDNVNITGNQITTTTWSPLTNLYTDAAATIAYTGTPATTVYVKGATLGGQTYTATATSAAGCPSIVGTSNITITPQPNATIAYAGTPYCAGGTAMVTVSGTAGTTGGTYSSTAGLTINATTGDVDLTTSTPGTYTVTYTKAAAGGCAIYTTTAPIKINASGLWLGVNTNWNSTLNWCGGLPTSATNVTIPAGLANYPIIISGINALSNNISIAAGASVIVSGTGVFNLSGTITNAGTFNLTDGTLNMAGTSPQVLAGTSISSGFVKNLTLSNAAGVALLSALAVTDSVSFGTSNVTFTTNDNLTLISNATGTARVADITHAGAVAVSGNSIVGKVSIERYLRAYKSWRFLATPIVGGAGTATINESWREGGAAVTAASGTGYGTRITGPGGVANPGGLDEYTLRGSMKSYNMTNNVYDEITSADLAANKTIANEQGYYVFIRGDRGVAVPDAAGTTTLRMKGQIRTGNQIFNVTKNRFQSIGNPFPSQIDFKKVSLSPEMVESFYIWNPAGGYYGVGQFEVYIKQIPGDPSSDFLKNGTGAILNTLESGQAVFVQNGNATTDGSVTIKETDKSIGSNLVSRVGINVPTLEINLFSKNSTGENYLADGTALNFNTNYSNNIDNKDVRKISNAVDNIAVKNAGTLLVVDRHARLVATDTIFLNLSSTRVAPYRFEIDPSVLNNIGLEAFLKDKFLQTTTAVSLTDVTNVPFDITADAASKAADRFIIVFKQAPTLNFTTIAATRNADKTITVNWGIQNERNVSTYSLEHSNDGINFGTLTAQTALANNGSNPTYSKLDVTATRANNWYRIKANIVNGAAQYSGIAMVAALPADQLDKPAIAVNPNPVEDKTVRIKFTNKAGSYTVNMVNSAGKTVYTGSMIVTNTAEVKTIALGKATAAGQYQLTITAAGGNKELLRVVVL